MTNYPQFAQVNGKKYKINTDYKVALKCENVSKSNVSEQERALAIIYLLFGDKGLKDAENWKDLFRMAIKYLNCGKEIEKDSNQRNNEIIMDFEQDWEYIRTSFFYDYHIRLTKNKYMHWWEFYNLLCGLSDKCVFSRVQFIRNYDISQIKDDKEREKWRKQKQAVALKVERKKTAEEIRLDKLFEEQLKGRC